VNRSKRITVTTLAALAAVLGASTLLPASAAPTSVTKVSTTCGTCVAPITCLQEDSCVLDFVGNNGAGYWRARQANGSVWVRLTLVNGN
jgi:hypothetical protein